MTVEFSKSAEPIPGYKLVEPLGRGGFGEVWKAVAPGGLLKAIKLVYGTLRSGTGEEVLVQEELRSLDRVKSVRHPYVIGLDRYDIIDGQLLIVMELADSNLWDRFKECQSKGRPGIPRDEMVDYMEEAAEALDLMNQKYGLQHADIKPQNLFLVHNHIKIADFGLVKDLKDHNVLNNNFFSPIYAAPETFEGKISPNSDQYSLAIVYQELLAGVRPFNGANSRQLLMQHMRNEPDLARLPKDDQPIVAKALAKNPHKRFGSCMEMVKALMRVSPDAVNLGEAHTPTYNDTLIIPRKHQLPTLVPDTGGSQVIRGTVQITCPHCNYTGRVPRKYEGQKVKCPECSTKFRVPTLTDTTKIPKSPTPLNNPRPPISAAKQTAEPPKAPAPAPKVPAPAAPAPTAPAPTPKAPSQSPMAECPVCGQKNKVSSSQVKCTQCGCVYRQ